jgi:hypothetical protein
MDEWEVDLEESLVGMFWWNLKPYIKTLLHIEKKQNFLGVYKVWIWKVKIRSKEHPRF